MSTARHQRQAQNLDHEGDDATQEQQDKRTIVNPRKPPAIAPDPGRQLEDEDHS
jgi:hypothetical protein